MILNIWMGSTAVCWATISLFAVSCKQRILKEGYKPVESNKSLSEKILELLPEMIKASIPVYNVIVTFGVLFASENLYNDIKKTAIEEGWVYKTDEKDIETKKVENTDNSKEEKTYEDMSIDEKIEFLEKEKQSLLREKASYIADTLDSKDKSNLQKSIGSKK